MARRPTGRVRGRPSKGPRAVIVPRVLLADEQAVKDLAETRGWYLSDTAAQLITIGLSRIEELPEDLPTRLTSAEASDFTVRVPIVADKHIRTIATTRDRRISIVAGALIQLGLRHRSELPGQIPAQYPTDQERPLTKAS